MPNTTTTYDPDRTVKTIMQREPMTLPAVPDFWANLREVQNRLPAVTGAGRQQPTAMGASQQGQALRGGGGGAPQQITMTAHHAPTPEYEPFYGTLNYGGGSAGNYMPWQPGQALGSGQQPVAMGQVRVRR